MQAMEFYRFRTTPWSTVLAAAAEDEAARSAFGELCKLYWRPLCSWAARRFGPEKGQELTQAFFVRRFVNGRYLKNVQRQPGKRFRSWLRASCATAVTRGPKRARNRRFCSSSSDIWLNGSMLITMPSG